MKQNIYIKIIGIYLLIVSTFCFFSCQSTKALGNKNLTVLAKEDGLHITKKHSAKFTNITIHIESDGKENISISTDNQTNVFIYPFVQKDKTYSVYLTMMDSAWQNFTTSESVSVTAVGGLGDCYIGYKEYQYDNESASIIMSKEDSSFPKEISSLAVNYTGSIYYDVVDRINWSVNAWGDYLYKKEGDSTVVDISGKLNEFMNKSFFIQLDCSFIYKNTKYSISILDNQNNLFSDTHYVIDISVNEGVLLPCFSPGITEYQVTGTDKATTVLIKTKDEKTFTDTINAENSQAIFDFDYEDQNFKFVVDYTNSEVISFNNKQYIETFSDDFNAEDLDTTKWRRSTEQLRQPKMKGAGWWRNECSYLQDGKLVIEAKQKGEDLASGSIESSSLFEQAYGLYEIKFKCDKTSGMWYAFWLMGDNDESHIGNGAVDAAEIDIYEIVPEEPNEGPNFLRTTINWDAYGKDRKAKGSPVLNVEDSFYDSYHVAKFIWDKDYYQLYLDDKLLWTMDGRDYGGICTAKNYIIISSEFGEWGGPLETSVLPAKMYVDYVKAYVEKQ